MFICRKVCCAPLGGRNLQFENNWHKALRIPYIYDYIRKLSRQHAEVIQNHENVNVCNTGQGEARHRKYKRLKFGGGQAYVQMNGLPL
jgi:hypothetical protein